MNKTLHPVLICLWLVMIPFTGKAQVAYDLPDAIPPFGTYTSMAYVANTTVSTTPPWNFSGIGLTPQITNVKEWLPATMSTVAVSFPGATHMLRYPAENYEELMQLTPTQLIIVGFAPGPQLLLDSVVFREFPSIIGNTYADTYWISGDPTPATVQITPHAINTLTTPFGTHDDVVMLQYQLITSSGNVFQNSFQWYAQNDLINPLAEYFSPSGPLRVFVTSFTTGVSEITSTPVQVWPVPSDGLVMISMERPIEQVEMLDAMGRTVDAPVMMNGDKCIVDLGAQSAGVYHLRLLTDNGWTMTRVVRSH